MRRAKRALAAGLAVGLIAVPVALGAGGLDLAWPDGGRVPGPVGRHELARRAESPSGPTSPRARSSAGAGVAQGQLVSVTVGRPVMAIPRSYLGLSLEYWGLPRFARVLPAFTRVLALLHPLGDGPLTLRVGGDSADRSLWDPGPGRVPQWVFRLNPRWLAAAGALVRSSGARLILDLNLVTGSPARAAVWARVARERLPRGSLAAFEIGNEPDIYDRPYWLATMARLGLGPTVLPATISPSSYVRGFRGYAAALGRLAPGVPLLGPAVAHPIRSLSWMSLLARRARSRLGGLTAHRYPYSACVRPGANTFPTVPRILSEHATAALGLSMAPAARLAHRAGLPLRMSELNSVTCGGRRGVSNTFATALWAPDALFELMRAGVDGVDLHVRADAVNAAMVPRGDGLQARPLLYGMVLFTRAVNGGGELLRTSLRGAQAPGLKAWAVRTRGGATRVLLINKGRRTVHVRVGLPGGAPAGSVQRMTAPAATATSGERLGGQWVGADGRWRGGAAGQSPAHGGRLTLAPASAALLTAR